MSSYLYFQLKCNTKGFTYSVTFVSSFPYSPKSQILTIEWNHSFIYSVLLTRQSQNKNTNTVII